MLDEKRKKDLGTLGRGAGLAGFGMGIHKLSAFAILALQVRYLGIENYGAFAIAFGISMLLMVPQRLGLGNGLSRFCVKARVDKDASKLWAIFLCGMVIPAVTGLILGLGLVILSRWINESFYDSQGVLEALIVFGLVLPLLGFADIPAIMTTAFETNRYAVISRDVVGQGSEILLLCGLYFLPESLVPKGSITAVIFVRTIGQLLFYLVGVYGFVRLSIARGLVLKGSPAGRIKALIGEIGYVKGAIFYCLPLMMGGAFQRIVQWTDTIMIGTFLGTFSAGVYRIAVQLATLLASILHAMGSIFGPITARYHHRGENEMIGNLYTQAARLTLVLAFPFIAVLAVFPEVFLSIFDHQAVVAGLALQLLVVGQMFNLFTGNVGVVLTMAGKPHWHAINGVVVATSHVIFCLMLIPRFGMAGAASATALAVILLNLMRVLEIKKFFGFHCVSKTILQSFIPATAAFAVVLAMRYGIRGYVDHFIVIAIVSTILSCLVSWGVHAKFYLSSEDVHCLRAIFSRLFSLKPNSVSG